MSLAPMSSVIVPTPRFFRDHQRVFELRAGIGMVQERLREGTPGRTAGAEFRSNMLEPLIIVSVVPPDSRR